MWDGRQLDHIVDELLAVVPADKVEGLAAQPATLLTQLFPPLELRPLPNAVASDGCSCDGYYDELFDPTCPIIFYDANVTRARERFTLLHEAAHHVIRTRLPALLDEIDQIAGPRGDPAELEELVCHRFAGRILVPNPVVDGVIGDGLPEPGHLERIYRACHGSWEATAVRVAERIRGPGAVILLRQPGILGFAAPSMSTPFGWARGSSVRPNGALARAFSTDSRSKEDTYRWRLPYAERFFTDTLRVNSGLAVAIMSRNRTRPGLSILEEEEPSWKRRLEYCLRCGAERTVGWCDTCRGRRCRECGSCGCYRPASNNRYCLECGLIKPFSAAANICVDCTADRT